MEIYRRFGISRLIHRVSNYCWWLLKCAYLRKLSEEMRCSRGFVCKMLSRFYLLRLIRAVLTKSFNLWAYFWLFADSLTLKFGTRSFLPRIFVVGSTNCTLLIICAILRSIIPRNNFALLSETFFSFPNRYKIGASSHWRSLQVKD